MLSMIHILRFGICDVYRNFDPIRRKFSYTELWIYRIAQARIFYPKYPNSDKTDNTSFNFDHSDQKIWLIYPKSDINPYPHNPCSVFLAPPVQGMPIVLQPKKTNPKVVCVSLPRVSDRNGPILFSDLIVVQSVFYNILKPYDIQYDATKGVSRRLSETCQHALVSDLSSSVPNHDIKTSSRNVWQLVCWIIAPALNGPHIRGP